MDKMPPNDILTEKALLGAFIIDSDCHDIIDSMEMEYFFTPENQVIFNSIKTLRTKKQKIDLLTVTNLVKTQSKDIKHWPYVITLLTLNVASGIHAGEHYYILLENFMKREIIRITNELNTACFENEDLEDLENRILELKKFFEGKISSVNFGVKMLTYSNENFESAKQRMLDRLNNVKIGINTGIGKLQKVTGGWQPGDLIYIAARPSMGKTAIAIFFAKQAAKEGYKVAFFSLEMSGQSITDRAVLGETFIDPEKWRNGDFTNFELSEYEKKKDELKNLKLYIYDSSSLRTSEVSQICKNEKFDIVFIDYIQLMKSNTGDKFQNRNLELGNISHELKAIAKEYDIPVICLSQLNRRLDATASKRPVLSDLRDSGELEQDADLVIFPFRPGVYDANVECEKLVELILIKHRNGRTGVFDCKHNDYMNNFYDENNGFTEPEFNKPNNEF
jgi:replicative DNA helicase